MQNTAGVFFTLRRQVAALMLTRDVDKVIASFLNKMQLLSARFGPQLPAFSCQCLCLCHLQKPPVLLQNGLVLSAASPRGRFCWVLTASCGRLLPLSLSRETFGALVTSMLGSSCIDWQLEVHLSFFFFGCFLMTKMPQMTYLHIQRSLRVTPQKQTCDDSLLLTWGVTCGSLEFFCSIQLCIHMPVKGFYRQPACLLFCVCACCLIGSAELLRGQQSPVPGGVLWAGTRSWASQQEPCPGLPALLSLLLSRSTQAFLAPPSASREPVC